MTYLLYGANGYTVQLIIKESFKQGLKPVLAGRNKEKIEAIAFHYGLDFSISDLENEALLKEKLSPFTLCLNAAGPFSKTAYPIAKACIATKTHYLDITGEIGVFEQIKKLDAEAKTNNIMLMPGVGFDVVPSDCLANYLKEKLPDAKRLELSFTSLEGGLSHGTATTMLGELGSKSVSRINGKLTEVKLAHKTKTVDFGKFSTTVATIPWGDISTAYTSTQITTIDVFTKIPRNALRFLKYQSLINPILKSFIFRKIAQSWVDRNIYGPSESKNKKGKSYLHGLAANAHTERSARLTCSEGYLLTAQCSVKIAQKVLKQHFSSGYQTPAMAYGWKLIMEIPGSELYDV